MYHQSTQYSLTQGAGKSSGFGLRAKQTTELSSGRVSLASAKKSITALGYNLWT